MKKSIHSLLALVAFGATALFAQAQPALKILTVDMAKLYDGHYKTEEQNAKLRGDEQKAQEELEKLNKELRKFDELKPSTSSNKISAMTELGHADAPPSFVFAHIRAASV